MKYNKIIALSDYKNVFGSKWDAKPYRGGMDKDLLKGYFNQLGYEFEVLKFTDFNFQNKVDDFEKTIVLYTSSEDLNYIYKDFIEDIILGVEVKGITVVPSFKFLRANNNKVFMEILRDLLLPNAPLKTLFLSAINDSIINSLNFPLVMKEASGAMSRGVSLIKNKNQLLRQIRYINRKENFINLKDNLKDRLRIHKHKGYQKESLHRQKFVLQEMIPNLKSDFKILIYGERYYIFERPIRKNDFRASGSGNKLYIYGSDVKVNLKMFDYAKAIYQKLSVPQVSLDICDNGDQYALFEFQALYFGTVGQFKSDGYYIQENNEWKFVKEKLDLEQVYAESIHSYLNR
jgi:glutathione synthase/RimK-type ligase-like ATP-grasp enzyme